MLWFLLIACQEPFEVDRHDLRGLRVATLTVETFDDGVRPDVTLVVDSRLWSDTPARMEWGFIDNDGDSAGGFEVVAEGPAPFLQDPLTDRLALRVEHQDQTVLAELQLQDRTYGQPRLVRTATSETLAALDDADDLSLESRRDWPTLPNTTLEPGAIAHLAVEGSDEASRARFMATGGTFFELDALSTHWVAGTLTVDDEVIEDRTPATAGPVSVVALVFNRDNGVAITDFYVGATPSGSTTHGRFLEGGLDRPYTGTLVADDDAPTGLRVEGALPASGEDWSAGTLPCVGATGPFNPNWLAQQRCSRAALDGLTVFVEPDP